MCPSSGETTVFMHSRSKHEQKRNKHTKKNCAPSWLYLQDYTGMHCQQNITNIWFYHFPPVCSICHSSPLFPFNPLNELEQNGGYFYR
jgi:hypothetical protein